MPLWSEQEVVSLSLKKRACWALVCQCSPGPIGEKWKMDDTSTLFISIGLSEQKVKETLKNAVLSATLKSAIVQVWPPPHLFVELIGTAVTATRLTLIVLQQTLKYVITRLVGTNFCLFECLAVTVVRVAGFHLHFNFTVWVSIYFRCMLQLFFVVVVNEVYNLFWCSSLFLSIISLGSQCQWSNRSGQSSRDIVVQPGFSPQRHKTSSIPRRKHSSAQNNHRATTCWYCDMLQHLTHRQLPI